VKEIARLASNTNLGFSTFSNKNSETKKHDVKTYVWVNKFIYVLSGDAIKVNITIRII